VLYCWQYTRYSKRKVLAAQKKETFVDEGPEDGLQSVLLVPLNPTLAVPIMVEKGAPSYNPLLK
jgi:hypothetical protein